jgi:tetrahydromethanopterin S-methyltransferase subunit G
MAATTNTDRLNRIEDKIDKMADAIIQLARVQVKVADLETRREEQHDRLNAQSSKLDDIEKTLIIVAEKVTIMQKIGWIAIVAIAILAGIITGYDVTPLI